MTTDPTSAASSDREAVVRVIDDTAVVDFNGRGPVLCNPEEIADAVLAALAQRGVSREGINAAIAVGYEAALMDLADMMVDALNEALAANSAPTTGEAKVEP
ncbi:MAG TPA: hypothetical protein VEA38_06645 [Terriglobales bacterium]|nr:hypothetical protein [Terriglobales bacterium]